MAHLTPSLAPWPGRQPAASEFERRSDLPPVCLRMEDYKKMAIEIVDFPIKNGDFP